MEKTKFNRVHLIVLDSVGIGESPDAHFSGMKVRIRLNISESKWAA